MRSHPKILVTPHLGASTAEAQTAVSVEAAKACLKYLRGEGIDGAVNAGNLRVDLDPTQAAYVELAQRLSKVVSPMITRGVAEITVTLSGESIAHAAGTVERAAVASLLGELIDEPVNLINVLNVAKSRGIVVRTVTEEAKSNRSCD